MTKEFDLAKVLGGTVDSVTEKFGDMSVDQLAQLRDLEKAGGKRTTLLDAIHREQKDRDTSTDDADKGAISDAATPPADTGAVPADSAKPADAPATFTQEQVDQMLAQQKTAHEEDKKLAVANATKGAKAPKPVATPKLTPLSIGLKADNVSLAALTAPTQVLFVNDHDTPLPGLAATTFVPADYEMRGEAVTLKREVDFPKELPRAEIMGAFLLDDDGDPVGKALLVQPFAIGGGRGAKLGANTLQFAGQPAA